MRARDAAGNASAWREAVVVIPSDDRVASFTSGSLRWRSAVYFRGTATATTTYGARMTVRFRGSSFALLGSTSRTYGRLRVTIDGRSWVVDTGYYGGRRETGRHYRVVLFSRALANGNHTVTITSLATYGRRTIAIDGFGWRS